MTSETETEEREVDTVRRKAKRMARGRDQPPGFWRQLGSVGVLGWVFVLPIVAFMGFGHWIGRRYSSIVPALIGGAIGVASGAWGVWRAVQRDLRQEDEK